MHLCRVKYFLTKQDLQWVVLKIVFLEDLLLSIKMFFIGVHYTFGPCDTTTRTYQAKSILYFSDSQLWGRGVMGRPPLSCFENQNKSLILGKKVLILSTFGLNFHSKCSFKNIYGKKPSVLISLKPICPEKILVSHLFLTK